MKKSLIFLIILTLLILTACNQQTGKADRLSLVSDSEEDRLPDSFKNDILVSNSEKDRLPNSFKNDIVTRTIVDPETVFMIGVSSNDQKIDWKTIFTISSVSKISPILLIENGERMLAVNPSNDPYLESSEKIDDFSPKLFIETYSPKKILLKNYEHKTSITTDQLADKNINSQIFDYSNFVVISDGNNYENSLIAASFAAHYGIPIFFSPLNNEEKDLIKKWDAKTIGIEVNSNYLLNYELTTYEAINMLKKDSDYLILTTSDDINKIKKPRFSLAAPILAGGRKGVVLNILNPTKESVKNKINEITKDGFSPSYIVVVGSKENFPYIDCEIVPLGTYYNQDDEYQYHVNLYYWADYQESSEYIPDAATGVITGYSVSDASSLIARSLFYDKIAKSNKVVLWHPYSDPAETQTWEPVLDKDFSEKLIENFKDFSTHNEKIEVIQELKDTSVFIYDGHAQRCQLGDLLISEFPVLKNPAFIFGFGCATLQPWYDLSNADYGRALISYDAIRKGAVGFFGAAEIWFIGGELYYGKEQRNFIENSLTMQIGDSWFLTQKMDDAYHLYSSQSLPPEGKNFYYNSYVYLIGDPKLKIKTKSEISSPILSNYKFMNFNKDAISEKFACYFEGGCTLCKLNEQECKELLTNFPDKSAEFYFPIFLDSYVYSTAPNMNANTFYYILNQMNLRFFTLQPLKDINFKIDSKTNVPVENEWIGEYCFKFKKQTYCPNLIQYLVYGETKSSDGKKWEEVIKLPEKGIEMTLIN